MSKLDFQPRKRTRNYLARREQWRLLLVVLALGAVILLIVKARDPANFAWIANLDTDHPTPASDEPVDTRLQLEPRAQESLDTVVSPAATPPPAQQTHDGLASVTPESLAAVEDDTVFRAAERGVWFRLLEILQDTSPADLKQESLGRVTFVQLFEQPKQYRGRVVSIAGTVRRANWVEAPTNDDHIKGYYQLWLQPSDHPSDPVVVYALELPPGFPTGMDASAEVQVTGIFFKRWAYQAQDTLRTAPVVLCRSVEWLKGAPTAVHGERPMPSPWLVLGLAVAIAGLVVGVLYLRTR